MLTDEPGLFSRCQRQLPPSSLSCLFARLRLGTDSHLGSAWWLERRILQAGRGGGHRAWLVLAQVTRPLCLRCNACCGFQRLGLLAGSTRCPHPLSSLLRCLAPILLFYGVRRLGLTTGRWCSAFSSSRDISARSPDPESADAMPKLTRSAAEEASHPGLKEISL